MTRSGTTLLRLMLDAHPDLAIPGETHWVPKMIRKLEKKPMSGDELAEFVIDSKRWPDFHLDPDALRERYAGLRKVTAADAIRAFYGLYSEREGKSRYGDKTPGYLKEMLRIQRVLPEARFIHIIRDGRDVSLSHMRMNWGPSRPMPSRPSSGSSGSRGAAAGAEGRHYTEVRFEDLVRDTEETLRTDLRVHRARLRPGDARLPRARRGAG